MKLEFLSVVLRAAALVAWLVDWTVYISAVKWDDRSVVMKVVLLAAKRVL